VKPSKEDLQAQRDRAKAELDAAYDQAEAKTMARCGRKPAGFVDSLDYLRERLAVANLALAREEEVKR
jgi:hypothetical protein